MKATIESTDKVIEVDVDGHAVPVRVWEGTTERGVKCQFLVTAIAAAKVQDTSELDAELQKLQTPPIAAGPAAAADEDPKPLIEALSRPLIAAMAAASRMALGERFGADDMNLLKAEILAIYTGVKGNRKAGAPMPEADKRLMIERSLRRAVELLDEWQKAQVPG